MQKIVLSICFACIIGTSFSQTNNENSEAKASYFKANLSYLNNSVYLGRKDSAKVPYITPSISYNDKSGFYIGANFSYLTAASEKRIDVYGIYAGYDFAINKKLSGSIYADKSFYNDSSNNVSSDIGASLSLGLKYDAGFATFGLNTGVSFASKNDYNGSIYASKYVPLNESETWSIEPSITANFNTLHFYEGYNNRSFDKKLNKKNPLIASITSTTTVNKNGFTLMDVELSVPLSYDAKKWGLYFTPTLAMPQNAINTTTVSTIKLRNGNTFSQTTDSTPDSEKNLSSTMFFEIGVHFSF